MFLLICLKLNYIIKINDGMTFFLEKNDLNICDYLHLLTV